MPLYFLAVLYVLSVYVTMRVSNYSNWFILFTILLFYFIKNSEIKVTKKTIAMFIRQTLFFLFLNQFSLLIPLLPLLGSGLNLIVVFANSKMPVSKTILRHYHKPDLSEDEKNTYMLIESGTRLFYLADIIYVPKLGILSIGDMLIYLGEFMLVVKYFLSL